LWIEKTGTGGAIACRLVRFVAIMKRRLGLKLCSRIADAINLATRENRRWERGYAYDDANYSCPDEVSEEEVTQAVEHSRRLRSALSGLLERGGVGAEFERLVANLKVMFGSPEQELNV
jgi:hypothetical protein